MQISALQPKVDASHVQLESLAGSKVLTEDQKIGEASRQFEAVLLRQFLTESQKTVIQSEFTDNSTASAFTRISSPTNWPTVCRAAAASVWPNHFNVS